ncbi:hypothetical protein AAC387_Pa02g0292 [Persea americana]
MATLSNLLSFLPAKSPNPTKTPSLFSFSPPYVAASSSSSLSCSKPCFLLSMTRNGYLPHDLSSVIWPSLTYSNTLFFSSPHSKRKDEELKLLKPRKYNVEYVVKDNEAEESLVRGFRSKVLKAGILQECKRRRFFENKQDKKKRKARDSAKKNRSRRHPPIAKQSHKKKKSRKKDEDEEEDNWELPEGELPY